MKCTRIAISGTHFTGKSTLVEDLIERLPDYESVAEAYYLLEEEGHLFPETPTLGDFEKQLARSIQLLRENRSNVIFDRCPIDYVGYCLSISESGYFDLDAWLPEIHEAVKTLDLIVFIPIEDRIPVPRSQNNDFRFDVDERLRDIFTHNALGLEMRVAEVRGSRTQRVEQVVKHVASMK